MPKLKRRDKRSKLEKEVDKILERMKNIDDPCSDEYQKLQVALDKLVQTQLRKEPRREKLNPNTLAGGVIALIEIFSVMNYEKLHVITTKAWGRICRGRI